jgi:hypothetical protein
MKTLCGVLVFSALLWTGCAKLVVVQVPAGQGKKIPAEGVFYSLPRTVVRVGIKVDKNSYTAAPYMKFARIFVPGSDPACKDQGCTAEKTKLYSLQKAVTFSTSGEPDPTNVYLVKFVGGGPMDQTMALTWTDTGLISTASASATNRTADIVVSGLKLAAGVAAKSAFGAAARVNADNQENADKKDSEKKPLQCPHPSANDSWILTILISGTTDTESNNTLVSNYCEIPKEDRAKDNYNKNPDNEALLKDAYTAYITHISPLTRARASLLSGTSPSFEPTAILTKLDTLFDLQCKALYVGTKEPKTWEGSLDIRKLDNVGELKLMHIDPANGICLDPGVTPGAPSGVTVSADSKLIPDGFTMLAETACKAAPHISMQTVIYPDAQLFQSVAAGTETPKGPLSFRYRIPAQVKADIIDAQSVNYGSSVFSVAQLGVVAALPARRRSKTISYDLGMVEATGGLKSFKTSSTGAMDAGSIDALSGIAGTLLDARNASNAADKTAKDEVTLLTRQDNILKLKADICAQQTALGQQCTIQP